MWWKFFGALEARIHRTSPIFGLLRFLEAFELDSSNLWDLGRWFRWFLFECFLYSKLKFLKFLEASKLGSNRVSGLLNLDLLQLFSFSPSLASPKCLRKASIYRSLGLVSDTWWSLIGDTCHSLIGPLISSLTRARIACVIAYTCETAYVIAYTCEVACFIAYTCWGVIGSCMTLGKFLLVSE